eukprot:4943765-Pyramimonas_sp.AAC.1
MSGLSCACRSISSRLRRWDLFKGARVRSATTVWAPAKDTGLGRGTSGGVAVIAPKKVQVTAGPLLADTKGVLMDGRTVAVLVYTWFKGGFVAVSAYLR